MRRTYLSLSLSLAAIVAVGGCASSSGKTGGSAASGSPSGSPTASSTSAVRAVDIPPQARANSIAGARAFVSFWVATLNKATTTGNTATLRALAAPTCAMCTDFANQLDKIYRTGGHVESRGWDVQSEIPIGGQKPNNPGIQLNVQVSPQKVYRTKNAKPQTYKGGPQGFRLFLIRRGDRWLVQRMEI